MFTFPLTLTKLQDTFAQGNFLRGKQLAGDHMGTSVIKVSHTSMHDIQKANSKSGSILLVFKRIKNV